MNAISPPSCMTQVKAHLPMHLSYFMQLHVAHLCALGVPAWVIATIVMELQLGKDDADSKGKARQKREQLAKVLLSSTQNARDIEMAAAGIVAPEADWVVWQEIVKWIWHRHPELAPAMLEWLYNLFCEGSLQTLDDAIAVIEANEPGHQPPQNRLR